MEAWSLFKTTLPVLSGLSTIILGWLFRKDLKKSFKKLINPSVKDEEDTLDDLTSFEGQIKLRN